MEITQDNWQSKSNQKTISTITQCILPYVLHLDSCSTIWTTIEHRLQTSNHSRVIQLKNELHNISMKTLTITQYLTEIKTMEDNIAVAGSTIDPEDVILYTLNGLPPTYQAFKTSIRTMLTPISLYNLYSLLISEQTNLASEASRVPPNADPHLALYSYRGRGRRVSSLIGFATVGGDPTVSTKDSNTATSGSVKQFSVASTSFGGSSGATSSWESALISSEGSILLEVSLPSSPSTDLDIRRSSSKSIHPIKARKTSPLEFRTIRDYAEIQEDFCRKRSLIGEWIPE
ncbi:hypothetical protein M5K25_013503 [Dendrobium thyrsiflorum]|uniref:Retrovirus-related Pol polyprotein from transposon TNT 1-94 n=1 Tax=Dendrobium thyrsiflorum TaxID=117978 RepID=A0ABD0UT23_DENTH